MNRLTGRQKALSVLVLIVLITSWLAYFAARLEFDYNFEHFFPKGDPELEYYLEFRDRFENDNDFMLLALENHNGIFDERFLIRVDQLSEVLTTMPHVEEVISPTQLKFPVVNTFGVVEVPYLHPYDADQWEADSLRISKSPEVLGTFFAQDWRSLCILIKNVPVINKAESDELLSALEGHLDHFDFDGVHLVGKVKGQRVFLEKMQTELVVFFTISALLVFSILLMTFRGVWGIVLPLANILLAILWILGLIGLVGDQLNIMTMLLPVIIFVVGMSDVIHLLSKYLEELRTGKNKVEALKKSIREVGLATLLTSITTAIGFFTLLYLNVQPIKEFGAYMGVGVFMAFVLTILFLPAILYLMQPPVKLIKARQNALWEKWLRSTFVFVLRRRKAIIVGCLLILGIAAIGISKINVNYYLLEDLDDDVPLKQDMYFLERHYAGVRPFEMALESVKEGSSILDYEVLIELNKLDVYLEEQYGVGFRTSPLELVKLLNKSVHGGKSSYYRLPENEKEFRKLRKWMARMETQKGFSVLVTEDRVGGRISGKVEDLGSKAFNKKNEDLSAFISSKINPNILHCRLTGSAQLIDGNNTQFIGSMMEGLSVAFAAIALLMGILYRSLRMMVISLLPNIIPLVLLAGFIGWMGFHFNTSISIVFTIAYGIAVDDTIHFLSRYKLERGKGKTLLYALKRTVLSTGRAIVLTTTILLTGFIALTFSDFKSTFYIGLLVSFVLVTAVVIDLLFLPVLLLYWGKKD